MAEIQTDVYRNRYRRGVAITEKLKIATSKTYAKYLFILFTHKRIQIIVQNSNKAHYRRGKSST